MSEKLIDLRLQQMRAEEEETISIEEARAMVHAAIHEEYAKV